MDHSFLVPFTCCNFESIAQLSFIPFPIRFYLMLFGACFVSFILRYRGQVKKDFCLCLRAFNHFIHSQKTYLSLLFLLHPNIRFQTPYQHLLHHFEHFVRINLLLSEFKGVKFMHSLHLSIDFRFCWGTHH
jgi:hypothetical protein